MQLSLEFHLLRGFHAMRITFLGAFWRAVASRLTAAQLRRWRRSGAPSLTRVDEYPASSLPAPAFSDLVDSTRAVWAGDPRVRIDDMPQMRVAHDGLWIAAWLLGGVLPIDPERLAVAIGSLPLLPREIYLLHQRDRLDETAIAHRLGLHEAEVSRELATAFRLLDEALEADGL